MQQKIAFACECHDQCIFSQLNGLLLRHAKYKNGEIIFAQGVLISGCFVLCSRKVKLVRRTSSGHKQTIKFLGDGDLFGESALLEARVSSVEAEACAESVVGWLRPGDFQELMEQHSQIAFTVQKRLACEVEELRMRLTELAYRGVLERLVALILELGEKYGQKSPRGRRVDLELTQCEIAEMLGVTREWASKRMSVLQKRGLIIYRRGEIVILDEAGLRSIYPPPQK